LTNFFSLPLMNAVGMFLEEAEEKDYLGILSFITLSYILVPFQAYASVKGFLEKEEGPWFRTPKTGKITDILVRGRFYRWIAGILPGRRPALGGVASSRLAPAPSYALWATEGKPAFPSPYLALATANNRFNQFRVKPRRIRGLANLVIVSLLLVSLVLSYVAIPLSPVSAFEGQFLFRDTAADLLSDETASPRKKMSRGDAGGTAYSVTLGDATTDANTYYFHDDLASSVSLPSSENATSSAALADTTMYGSQRHLHRDKYGNLIFVHINTNSDIVATFKNFDASSWSSAVVLDAGTVHNVSSGLDNSGNIQMAWEELNAGDDESIYFKRVPVTRNASDQITGFTTSGTVVTIFDATGGKDLQDRPSLAIDASGRPVIAWQRDNAEKTAGVMFSRSCSAGVMFSRSCSADASDTADNWETATGDCGSVNPGVDWEQIEDTTENSDGHVAMGVMPNTGDLYVFGAFQVDVDGHADSMTIFRASVNGSNFNAWTEPVHEEDVGTNTTDDFDLTVAKDDQNDALVYVYADGSNYTEIKSLDDDGSTVSDLSSPASSWGSQFSVYITRINTTNRTVYVFYKDASNNIHYTSRTGSGSWSTEADFDTGTSNSYPSAREEDEGSSNDLGGRVDVAY
jgi:hypothetical protein